MIERPQGAYSIFTIGEMLVQNDCSTCYRSSIQPGFCLSGLIAMPLGGTDRRQCGTKPVQFACSGYRCLRRILNNMALTFFKGGLIADGSGSPAISGNLLVEDDRIVAVGDVGQPPHCVTIDCHSL